MKIAPATAAKIAENTPKGQRHQTAKEIAVSMAGDGNSEMEMFSVLRGKFEPDVTDGELQNIVVWAAQRPGLLPSRAAGGYYAPPRPPPTRPPEKPSRSPEEQTDWWLSGSKLEPERLAALSPVKLSGTPQTDTSLVIGGLYRETDSLNVICKFTLDGEKTRPVGSGQILKRDEWLQWFTNKGVPSSQAGAWFRINPCTDTGTGDGGAVTDKDVSAYRYLLLESDLLPIATQLALFYRLKLPIAAIVLSGGSSAHAWVKLDAEDGDRYRETAKRILADLKPFGIDQANGNPSRMSRLPGAVRIIGGVNGGLQRVIWLNPEVGGLTEEGLKTFEASLRYPAIDKRPFRPIVLRVEDRVSEMRKNVGKLGVPTGIPSFDDVSGGLKAGHTIVVAGETGAGKSTVGLHFVASALAAGIGVALFSLEMDSDEICDLLLSQRCMVDRNKFNTGTFSDADVAAIIADLPALSAVPLYIEDSSLTCVSDIQERVMQLKQENAIGLVVVDYIQFINTGATKDNREQQVAGISHELRTLAREAKVPVVVLSQLNEDGKLRESRVIAHNANIVMLVEVEGDDMVLKVIKGRSVPTGEFRMSFQRRFAKLVPRKPSFPAPPPYVSKLPYKES